MIEWQNNPPTNQEWSDAHNEGYWWIKTTIPSFTEGELVFPASDIYDIVRLGLQIDREKDNLWEVVMNKNGGRLSFDLHGKHYDCNDLPENFGAQWQPVVGHSDRT